MLQWPRYGQLRDTPEVLLAESEETYKFIEKVSPLFLPIGLLFAPISSAWVTQ